MSTTNDNGFIRIEHPRWGQLEFRAEDIIYFPQGLVGFERLKRFAIFQSEDTVPFAWMISVDDPDIGFAIINPMIFCPDYNPNVSQRELRELKVTKPEEVAIYSIVTLNCDPRKATANLSGPIFINTKQRLAKQVVLLSEQYSSRWRIVGECEE